MSEACPACGADGRPLAFVVEDRFRLHRCRGCGTQFFRQLPDRESPPESELSAYWQPHTFRYYSDPDVRAAFGRRYAHVIDTARRYAPMTTALDVGCGTGNFLDYAQHNGLKPFGVDLDPDAVAVARERGLPAHVLGATPLPSGFDALSMWDVVEHIIDPATVLRDLLTAVNPGGALLFETPDGAFPVRRLVLWLYTLTRGRLDLTPPFYYWEHKVYFTARGLRAMLRRLGCEVVHVERATSVREKMSAMFSHEAGYSTEMSALNRVWPLLETVSRRIGFGNKLLVVAIKN